MIKTENFSPLTDPKLLCTCGHKNCDKRGVKQHFLKIIQEVRNDANRPLKVTSGGRCPNHKNEAHRDKPADHQKGMGIDIAVNGGLERGQIVGIGLMNGLNAIGVAKTFVHLGFREELKDGEVMMWVY